MHELIIVGAGPAGVSAAVYAARKKIKTALITQDFGGQSKVSNDIHNWIGTPSISGTDLAKSFEDHVKNYSDDIDIIEGVRATAIEKTNEGFTVKTSDDKEHQSRTLLLALGSHRRRLGVPGEDEFDGKGVVYCSTCDAPLFKDQTVAIVGGGNSGLEAVVDSIPYAKKIYLLVRSDQLKGDATTQEKVKNHEKVEILYNTEIKEIHGETFVTKAKIANNQTNEESELEVGGVFVEIGSIPSTEMVKDLVDLNERGEVIVDHKTQQSSQEGIWAAGDISDVMYKQNNISSGDAVKALLNIYDYLHRKGHTSAHE